MSDHIEGAERPDAVVAVAGDWHGATGWALGRIQSLAERGIRTILHVGDFGIWPGNPGAKYLHKVERTCAKYGVEILVTVGNHEDHGRLTRLWANPRRRAEDGTMLPLRLTDHVIVMPRGHRWEMGGQSFVSLGGAPSVDFLDRTPNRDWWAEEMITQEDVARTVAGGYADVMLSHDAPGPPYATPTVAGILAHNPQGWPETALAYAAVGRKRITEAFLGVAPRLLVHGHYHVDDETTVTVPGQGYETAVWSLAANGMAGNVRLLDLKTLTDPAPVRASS